MRDKLEVYDDKLGVCSKQWWKMEDVNEANEIKNSCWKHCMSRNACDEQSTVNLIGSAAGVSVNTEVRPIKVGAAAAEYRPPSAHQQAAGVQDYNADLGAND